jgi:uncharacterized protein (TIGR03067 family)
MHPVLEAMQGTWLLTQALSAGRPVEQGEALLVIAGERFERRTPAHTFLRRAVVRDSAAGVAELDLHVENQPGLGDVLEGLVEVRGDELRICHAAPGRPRPASFSSTAADGQVLSVSRRRS